MPLSAPVQNAQFTHFKQSLEKIWHTNRPKAKDLDGFAGIAESRNYPNGENLREYSTTSRSFFPRHQVRRGLDFH
jgi:hypothetical protein